MQEKTYKFIYENILCKDLHTKIILCYFDSTFNDNDMENIKQLAKTIEYKSYSITEDHRNPYSNKADFMFYPTAQGIQHDADYDGDYHYTGNCKWADSMEEAIEMIDELLTETI